MISQKYPFSISPSHDPRSKSGNSSVQVKFNFMNEMGRTCEISINPFSPLINYKRFLENNAKIDLYGKKLIFRYSDPNNLGKHHNIQYLQEIVDKLQTQLKSIIQIDVLYQEIGG